MNQVDALSQVDETLSRQEALGLQTPASVAVVGCGGVGSWTSYFLALAGVQELWLFDGDRVSETNLNRVPFPAKWVGKRKVDACAGLIKSVRPKCSVLRLGVFDPQTADLMELGKSALGKSATWVVATTDSLASRRMVHGWAQRSGVRYLEASAEGEYGSVAGSPAEWCTPEESQPGYASVPVWVGPCVSAAAMAAAHVLHGGTPGDKVFRVGWGGKEYDVYGR